MIKILFGSNEIQEKTVLTSLINANSPMTFDATMLGAATVYAENNQATMISPFILAGAMSPVSVAGTLTQILAEAMAGMSYIQCVRPGAPVVFGTFASALSMQSGAPTFGGPEPSLVIYGAAQLAPLKLTLSQRRRARPRKFLMHKLLTSQQTPCKLQRLQVSISCCTRRMARRWTLNGL